MVEFDDIKLPFDKSSKVIVAVSGGADSVVLLDVLHRIGVSCIVAHCNFHLRGAESDRDEKFVQKLSEKYDLPSFKIDFSTKTYSELKSVSIEMAARELRYAWFRQLLKREKARCIAVAHHSDDVIETFLMNMSRGTGIRGLSGIKSFADDVWRPLLPYSKEDILDYASKMNLSYVTDSTNLDTAYIRNNFRNVIVPEFQKTYPSFKRNLLNTIRHLNETERYADWHLQNDLNEIILQSDDDCLSIDIIKLSSFNESSHYLLYEILSKYGFSSSTVDDVERMLRVEVSGRVFYSKNNRYRLDKERDRLVLRRNKTASCESYIVSELLDFDRIPLDFEFSLNDAKDLHIEKKSAYCYLDYDKLNFPLTLRHWRNGDYFVPFGMSGKKKLSDFFIDGKFSEVEKRNAWLLLSGDDITWIVGHRADNRFRVTYTTRRVLALRFLE